MGTESVESYAYTYIGIVKLIQISFYSAKLHELTASLLNKTMYYK